MGEMETWKQRKLGEIFSISSTTCTPAASPSEKFIHHSIPAFDDFGGPVEQYGEEIESNKFLITRPCILVSKLNPRISRVQPLLSLEGKFREIASTEFIVYAPNLNEHIDLNFYHHLLSSRKFIHLLSSYATGTTGSHTRVKPKDTLQWEIAHPPLVEQQRIAEILEGANNQIHAYSKGVSKLRIAQIGLMGDFFPEIKEGGRGKNASPDAAKKISLWECGHWISGGTPSTDNPRFWNGEIPWISAASLKEFHLWRSDRRLTKSGSRAGTGLVSAGAVLFVVRGMSLKSEFRVGVAERDLAFGQDCKAIVPSQGIDGTFLALSLKAKSRQILSMVDEAGHGTGRLPTDLLAKLEIEIPPVSEQLRVVSAYNEFGKQIEKEKENLDRLRLLKQALMDDLLTGRVRVPIEEYEKQVS